MTNKPSAPAEATFTPVRTRARHDGWTPAKQLAFIDALAASGCVQEACDAVGLSTTSAYQLRARIDAQGFRVAWDAALDYAVRRLSDAAFSRAINGVAVPHFYKGEQIGEHRRYDERLAMFLMRYRDPLRYAATLDKLVFTGHPERAAIDLAKARDRAACEAHGETVSGAPSPALPFERRLQPNAAQIAAAAEEMAREQIEREQAARWAEEDREHERRDEERREQDGRDEAESELARRINAAAAPFLARPMDGPPPGAEDDFGGDVSPTSPTSGPDRRSAWTEFRPTPQQSDPPHQHEPTITAFGPG